MVRSQFGYHVIQVTERRTNALEQADQLVTRLKEDPDSFAEVAEAESEDVSSAQDGGELGWVIHYQYDAARDEAIFAMTEPDEISDPVVTGAGIYIYKLLNSADQRFVPQHQRDQVGDQRLQSLAGRDARQAGVWVDSEFTATSAGGAG